MENNNVISSSSNNSTSWYESLREFFPGVSSDVFDIALFSLIGFFTAFFLKNFGRMMVMLLIILFAIGGFSHVAGFELLPFNQLSVWLGISSFNNVHELLSVIQEWVGHHTIGVLAGSVGFIIGWKVG